MTGHSLPRLAWFTPLPPVRSGIARYNVELLPGLADAYQIELFVDAVADRTAPPDPRMSVFSAHDFVWKHFRRPYDLVVYQLGNAPCHDYMWGYLARYPGLVVLHDGQLHHARGRWLIEQKREDDYRSEFAFNHPGTDVALAELGIAGLLGSLTYLWPMRRVVIESARMVAVHNEWLADQIREEHPDARVAVVDMGVPAATPRSDANTRIRARHGIGTDDVLFMAFGDVTPEKRIAPAIHALAAMADAAPRARLLLTGQAAQHYDPRVDAQALGIADRVTIAGFVGDDEVDDYLAAADACLCLRWPTSRETSAAWLRCLAAGRPTIVTDLVHMVDIPSYDPRTWSVLEAPPVLSEDGGGPETASREPVCVSIDLLDEDHSLRLAMRRLAADARLRAVLGRRAREMWSRRFTLERMISGYRDLIARALSTPSADGKAHASLPRHFTSNGTEHAARLLERAGLPPSRINEIWRGLS